MRRKIIPRLPLGEDSRTFDRTELAAAVPNKIHASAQPAAVDLDPHDIARDQLSQGPPGQSFRTDVTDAGAG